VIYLCYFCKFTKECVYHERAEIIIIIGATVGISQVIWFFAALSGYVGQPETHIKFYVVYKHAQLLKCL